MATFNYSTRQMTVKIVYYGPGLGGKTTNLQYLYEHTTPDTRGEMVSLETQADRTLFFDLLPLEVGTVAGFNTRIQLYTVPGQVFYNTTRKLVLKGVDGIVFVADSQSPMLSANLESFRNLEANLAELGILIGSVPLVIQYNKRDLNDLSDLAELDSTLNTRGLPTIAASALTGEGVFETLRAITRITLLALKKQLEEGQIQRSFGPGPAAPARGARSEGAEAGADNGDGSQAHSLVLDLKPADFERARRLLLNLQVEDGDRQIVHEVHDLRVDLADRESQDERELRLSIRLSPKG